MFRSLLFPQSPPGIAPSVSLLLLRVVAGSAFMLHGWPKIQKPMSWMQGTDFPGLLQGAAALAEFGGGALWVAGGLTALASLGIGATMGVAVWFHFSKGHPFVGKGGPAYELATVYLAIAIVLFILGPGKLSVDAFLGGRKKEK
ncbi:MAG: DoxX family protein [Candidatus Brocadiae bacterium]|nr:DoxX family protein [Candidatus Brocadiia bacterium]